MAPGDDRPLFPDRAPQAARRGPTGSHAEIERALRLPRGSVAGNRRPSLVTPLALLLALAVGSLAGAGDDTRPLEFPDHGFRLRLPAGWEHRSEDGADGCRMRLTLAPRGRSAEGVVTLWVRDADEPAEATDWRDLILRHLATQPQYAEVRPGEQVMGDRVLPALEYVGTYAGRPWRARQATLDHGGLRYVFQEAAPVAQFDAFRAPWEAVLAAFEPIAPSSAVAEEFRLRAMAARCGEDLGWAEDWESAAARARAAGRWVLVYVRAYAGFRLSDHVRTLTFTDPDVVELVRERFVPLRLTPGAPSPLRSPDAYGMGEWTFGSAVLVATPAGEVRADIGCLQPWALYEALRALGDPPGRVRSEQDREDPEALVARGELEAALARLMGEPSERARVLRAGIHRRLRHGSDALAEIASGAARDTGPRTAGERGREDPVPLLLEEGRVLLRLGRHRGARDAFARVARQAPGRGPGLEALYWLGALLLQEGRKAEAEAAWRALATEHPEDRWAWRAAGMLVSTGFAYGVGERLEWPAPAEEAAVRRAAPGPLPAARARDAERDAVLWLVRQQRADGSWTSPTEAAGKGGASNDFTEAITALAALALRRAGDTPTLTDAAARARDFLLARRVARRLLPETPAYMDYGVWRDACVLVFLADLARADEASRSALGPAMEEIVRDLLAKRRPSGGWSYFVTVDLGATADSETSISFITATATLALLEARDAGVEVPPDELTGALECLESLRRPDGTFAYMTGEVPLRGAGTAGAAGRGPICSLALLAAGREDRSALRRRLDLLLEHRQALWRERGKALMHTGMDGQGSHYLLFDLASAALAVQQLPEEEREAYRGPLLEDLLRMRDAGGAFLDSPLLGRDFGAAAALLALQALAPVTPR